MTDDPTPLLLEPNQLYDILDHDELVIVDLTRPHVYARNHIPGAVRLDYTRIIASHPPVQGLLPGARQLAATLGSIGITPDSHVIAYDDEGGGKACRLLWTLDAVGHQKYSLLNGGLPAWVSAGLTVSDSNGHPGTIDYPVEWNQQVIADKDYILAHLDDPHVALVDTRTVEEYRGADKRALKTGHIPGAVNIEWSRAIDQHNSLRLKSRNDLLALYLPEEITPDREIITYCHTHHRSAHTYIVLKYLGYTHIRGYHGSWSEWGNDPDTPVT